MQEQQIVEHLKQAIPAAPAPVAPPEPEQNTNNGQATIAPAYELDEMTQYKLHDYFSETYKPNDEVSNQQVRFIYEQVAARVDNPEYGFVLAKIRELERIIGTANSDRRIYRLYQWLKLDAVRRNTEAEMGALTDD